MSERPLLQVSSLYTRIGRTRAVDGVDFELRAGETFALLGESGCGKSMTALSLMRLLPAAGRIVAGQARLGDTALFELPERDMRGVRGGRMAMIFQEPMTSLNPVMRVGEQIAESLRRHKGHRRASADRRVRELLEAVGIPDPARRQEEYPHQLSGGMKQRVMIAIALAGEPDLLIADEPTTALDVTIQAQVLDLLKEIQQRTGMAILLITHDLGVVAQVADRVAVMYAGQIVEIADKADFFRDPLHPYSRKLFASVPNLDKRSRALSIIPGSVPSLEQDFSTCRFAERCDLVESACRQEEPDWHAVDTSRGARCRRLEDRKQIANGRVDEPLQIAEPDNKGAEPLLAVRDLKVYFPIHRGLFKRVTGHVKAVDGIDLNLPAGHTLALVGESGCGKTTLGKGVLQLLRPTAGEVLFDGLDLAELASEALRRKRRDFQIIFQDPFSSMNPRMLVGDIVAEGLRAQGLTGSRAQRQERVAGLLRQVGLPVSAAARYPHEFSGGQRQRICIARALAVEPRLIVCDEPTSALDVSVQAQILNLLKDLQDRLGLSYLFITHNLSVVAYLAHELAVMYLGRIVEQGPVREILEQPRHPYTQALLSAIPSLDPAHTRPSRGLTGDPPSPAAPPPGCHFRPRCPSAMAVCATAYPPQAKVGTAHYVRCYLHFPDQ